MMAGVGARQCALLALSSLLAAATLNTAEAAGVALTTVWSDGGQDSECGKGDTSMLAHPMDICARVTDSNGNTYVTYCLLIQTSSCSPCRIFAFPGMRLGGLPVPWFSCPSVVLPPICCPALARTRANDGIVVWLDWDVWMFCALGIAPCVEVCVLRDPTAGFSTMVLEGEKSPHARANCLLATRNTCARGQCSNCAFGHTLHQRPLAQTMGFRTPAHMRPL